MRKSGYPWNPLAPNGDGKPSKPAGPDEMPFRKQKPLTPSQKLRKAFQKQRLK